jgi:Integrase zinc binding domain
LREKIQNHPESTLCKITEHIGLLRYKSKVCVGNTGDWRSRINSELHASQFRGHSGITATYQRIKRNFYWPLLKEDVYKFVQNCSNCQINKGEHTASPGLLQPLPIPKED